MLDLRKNDEKRVVCTTPESEKRIKKNDPTVNRRVGQTYFLSVKEVE